MSEHDYQLLTEALSVFRLTNEPKAALLQRRLRIGYNRAADLLEKFERLGLLSSESESNQWCREFLVDPELYELPMHFECEEILSD